MSLSEQEKNNLVNDGKFTRERVNYYDSTGISYDKIKELQRVLVDSARMDDVDSSLYRINEEVDDVIRITFENAINRNRGRFNMNELIEHAINDIQQLNPNNTDSSYGSESESESIGGKRLKQIRRKRKSRKSKRKRSKRLGKRGRKTRKYVK
jgi:hypothetical protein